MAIKKEEKFLLSQTQIYDAQALFLLRSVPGIGVILAMTLFYEIEDIARFARVQQFASYARLVKGQKTSAGKHLGSQGGKMGNAHLKWAFSEAAILFLRESERAKKYVARLESKHGKKKALSGTDGQDRTRRLLYTAAPRGVRGRTLLCRGITWAGIGELYA